MTDQKLVEKPRPEVPRQKKSLLIIPKIIDLSEVLVREPLIEGCLPIFGWRLGRKRIKVSWEFLQMSTPFFKLSNTHFSHKKNSKETAETSLYRSEFSSKKFL